MMRGFGFVEGFYWAEKDRVGRQFAEYSHEERREIISFLGKKGLDTYVYAPKLLRHETLAGDGKFLKAYRPELHTEQAEWEETLEIARRSGVNLVWGISPGWLYPRGYHREDIHSVMAKLKGWGVNRFAMLFDDAGGAGTPRQMSSQVELLRYLADLFPGEIIAFCSSYYHRDHQEYTKEDRPSSLEEAFSALDGIPEDISFVFTGNRVWNREIDVDDIPRLERARKVILWDNQIACDRVIDYVDLRPPAVRTRALLESLDGYWLCGCFPANRYIPVISSIGKMAREGFADYSSRRRDRVCYYENEEQMRALLEEQASDWYGFLRDHGHIDARIHRENIFALVQALSAYHVHSRKKIFDFDISTRQIAPLSDHKYLGFFVRKLAQLMTSSKDSSLKSAGLFFAQAGIVDPVKGRVPSRGKIGPRRVDGWDLHDVLDDGNCFYYAMVHQLNLKGIATDAYRSDDYPETYQYLRFLVEDSDYQDCREVRGAHDILALAKALDVLIAIADTRGDEHTFVFFGQNLRGELDHSMRREVFSPEKTVAYLSYTGDHYLSVLSSPGVVLAPTIGS